jgi:hypothetical protein
MTTSRGRSLARLARLDLVPGERYRVAHSFSFPLNRQGAFAAYEDLAEGGWPERKITEELSGDDYWHIMVARVEHLTEHVFVEMRQVAEVAQRHGGRYDGCTVNGRKVTDRQLP